MTLCEKCAAPLDSDDIGIYRKLCDRECEEGRLCRRCIARELGCGTEVIERKIAEYKAMGCLMFPVQSKT